MNTLATVFCCRRKVKMCMAAVKGENNQLKYLQKTRQTFFTNHTEMAFAEEEEKNKNWFQPKAEPEKINWYSPTGRLDFH